MSKVLNARRLRNKLRRFEPEVKAELLQEVKSTAEAILQDARARVHSRSGRLAQNMRVVLQKSGFSAKIGIVGKKAAKKAWYAYYVEKGTPSTTYKRGPRKGKPRKPVRPHPFLVPAYNSKISDVNSRLRIAIDRAISRTMAAGGD